MVSYGGSSFTLGFYFTIVKKKRYQYQFGISKLSVDPANFGTEHHSANIELTSKFRLRDFNIFMLLIVA